MPGDERSGPGGGDVTDPTSDRSRERFEDVDWETIDADGRRVSTTQLLALVAGGLYALALAYDVLLAAGDPTVEVVVAESRFLWDATGVDWLFVATLLVLGFAAVPLARNRRLTAYYWQRFRRHRLAVLSLVYLVVIFLLGTVGTLFIDPPTLHVAAGYQPPVFLSVDVSIPTQCLGPVVDGRCQGTWRYPLGTTGSGKGLLALAIFGMRVSLQVGLIATLISVTVATAVGATAAYAGGWVDEVLMRYVDVQQTFPTFFLFLFLAYLYGGSLFVLIVIFGLTGWGGIARIVRSEALQRREETYVQAAQSAGASGASVVWRHIVPNVSNSIVTAATLNVPVLILSEAALSFIGLGDVMLPSWGQTIAAGRGDLATAWWISTIPGLFLFATILAFNFLGDALRDALDPRQEVGR
ncbi:ABC transporter permease [Halobellus inordinatus]|uniref:ABC transporter permease n=1 Tax=Halobellus inordinatus TaxID=1126236 RepID=UPI00210CBA4F|nr:ABC transporter permease [Halobellus inordinatus]